MLKERTLDNALFMYLILRVKVKFLILKYYYHYLYYDSNFLVFYRFLLDEVKVIRIGFFNEVCVFVYHLLYKMKRIINYLKFNFLKKKYMILFVKYCESDVLQVLSE